MSGIRLDTPAKINLTLNITGRRGDGYHLMESLVTFADLKDIITITPAEKDRMIITGPYEDDLNYLSHDDNIIMKALNAFRDNTRWDACFEIILDKHIPVAAGIGGGSSNAAALLTFLRQHYPTPIDDEALFEMGLSLGADLPVCLGGMHHHLWRMSGIGDVLDPVDYPPSSAFGMVLMNPGIAVPTRSIFAALDPKTFSKHGVDHDVSAPLTSSEFRDWLNDGNTMENAAGTLHNEVKSAVAMMRGLDRFDGFMTAGMSGSGSTVFALFETKNHALIAHKDIINLSYWSWSGGIYRP